MHFFRRKRAEEIDRRTVRVAGIDPAGIVTGLEDDWHPVVDGLGELVGIGRENRKGLEDWAIFRLPSLSQSSEGIGFAAAECEREGLRGLGGRFRWRALPLVKGVGGDETAAAFEGFAKEGL